MGSLKGLQVSHLLYITHLLFVDDVLIFYKGSAMDAGIVGEILDLFSKATGIEINAVKSTLTSHLLSDEELLKISRFFPYRLAELDGGLKHLGFVLKPNSYQK